MAKWVLLLCEALILLLVFWTSTWDGKAKKQRLFSITLPSEALKSPELLEIQSAYRHQINLSFLVLFMLIILSFFLKLKYFSLEIVYFLIVLTATIALPNYFYAGANRKVQALKLSKQWEAGHYSHGIHEDLFWIYGQFYNNPHDSARSASKRMGIGTTINWAHKGQRKFYFVTLSASLILTLGLLAGLFYMEIKTPVFKIEEEHLSVNYPIYYYHLPLENIKGLTVIQELPFMSKQNGIETVDFKRGYYSVEDYGRVFICVYTKGPFIVIKTNQDTLIVNEISSEKTYALLEALDLVLPK
jgi:hypothetical protein